MYIDIIIYNLVKKKTNVLVRFVFYLAFSFMLQVSYTLQSFPVLNCERRKEFIDFTMMFIFYFFWNYIFG